MAADPGSPLHAEERSAITCWLNDLPSDVMILVPEDVVGMLAYYLSESHPCLLAHVKRGLMPFLSLLPVEMRLDSPLEDDFLQEWYRQGLDLVWPLSVHYAVLDGLYKLDFAYVPFMIGIELDGYTYHSDRNQFIQDRQRQRTIEREGWHIMRFASDELFADMERCVEEAAHILSVYAFRKQ